MVQRALREVRGEPFDVVAETIKRTAFKITRVGELVAQEAAKRLGVPFGIVDLSLAPTPARGDSVAYILQEMGLEIDRRARHHGGAGHAQRRGQKGRRDGLQPCGRALAARSSP